MKLFPGERARCARLAWMAKKSGTLMRTLADHQAERMAILGPLYEAMMQEAARAIVTAYRAQWGEGGKSYLDADEDE